jgi:dTDP-4-dehydrorhamnose reductase
VRERQLKIAVIGAKGQLGSDLIKAAHVDKTHEAIPLTQDDIEISIFHATKQLLTKLNPNIIINTAAFHLVDMCEDEIEAAFRVNAQGVRNLGLICREMDIPLVHISTDYVFDGQKKIPYVEDDAPHPQSIYAISKLAGELILRYLWYKHYVIRVSGLYGMAGALRERGNFVEIMIRMAEAGKDIKVVNDQVLTPTYTLDAAEKIIEISKSDKYGIYHVTNTGECSWYEFTQEIFRLTGMKPHLVPISSKEFAAKAKRPLYSVLDNRNLRLLGLEDLRDWHEALAEYLQERKQICQENSTS